jgi:beta-aspartyl-peptidase (threonine type)
VAEFAIAIHGGAGLQRSEPNKTEIRNQLKQICGETFSMLKNGREALDAVERAVYLLEDSGLFNAGRGACLTSAGTAELDAGICDGRTLSSGAVTGITNYAHPIEVARFIMENTNMVMMRGDEAIRLMQLFKTVEPAELVTPAKLSRLRQELSQLEKGASGGLVSKHFSKDTSLVLKHKQLQPSASMGTVGAVAVDLHGNTAAAASTGGYWLKISGRVGDSPILGAGFYADSKHGAAAATGVGEYTIRLGLSRKIVEKMNRRVSPQQALNTCFRQLEKLFGVDNMGVIAVDKYGRVGVKFNTEGMGHAYESSNNLNMTVKLFPEEK